MQTSHPASPLLHGAIGGVAAGAVVALWFLVLDLATAEAFHTPAVLAGAIIGDLDMTPTFRIVATYTILHFGVFTLMGMATAWFLDAIGVSPGLLVGAVFGLVVLNSVYYGALLVPGAQVLTILPVFHVLGANLAGGMVLMAYLHHALHTEAPLGLAVLRGHPLVTKGMITGFIGGSAVALWFLIVDLLASSPFYTPAALGSAVLFGATSPEEVHVGVAVIAAYTVVHFAAFVVVGIALVWSAKLLEQTPGMWLTGLLAFIVIEGLFLGTMGSLGGWVLGTLSWWAVGIGNLIAVLAMGMWVWATHPKLRHELLEKPVETRV
ncbi:MAG TPA: hypothetical protein VK922_03995 [Gemmatimonadaceae bacterium]|nr:hypothetical protein [Gemmatimonadaceae bacterium]